MNREEVLKLAKLARIGISDDEAETLSHEFEAILNYVGEIKEAKLKTGKMEKPILRNVMRDDANPHESGIHTEALLDSAPEREGQFLKVKKIL